MLARQALAVILAVAILSLIYFIFINPIIYYSQKPKANIQSPQGIPQDLQYNGSSGEGLELKSHDLQNGFYNITSQSGFQNNNILDLTTVKWNTWQEPEQINRLNFGQAQSGILNRDTNLLKLKGKVSIHYSSMYQAFGEEATIDLKSNNTKGSSGIIIHDDQNSVSGKDFFMDNKQKIIKLKDDVQAIIN